MAVYLEHANLTVPDIDAAIAFLRHIDPGFVVRRDETPTGSHRWVHIGSGHTYIALQQPHVGAEPDHPLPTYENYGVNHLAWVVDDFDSVVKRLESKGYKRGKEVAAESYRKRAYFYDTAGFEWEIIEYLSQVEEHRNLYE